MVIMRLHWSISSTHSFYKVGNGTESLNVEIKKSDDQPSIKVYPESGYYANKFIFTQKLSKKINSRLQSEPELSENNITFSYSERGRRVSLQMQCTNNLSLHMSEALKLKLGFPKAGPYFNGGVNAPSLFDIHAGQRLMYIYCDAASYNTVGEIRSPLLRVCNVRDNFGQTVHDMFIRPLYVPVSRNEFDTNLVNIRYEMGKPMPFEFGKTVVTLHFRRRHNFA